ncbi:MAG: START domain-containing protein [Saprospiraceae bacterium]
MKQSFLKQFLPFQLKHSLLFLVALFSFMTLGQAQENDWKLKKNKDGIEVYLKERTDSPLKELRIKTTIKGTLSAMLAVLDDLPKHKEWIYRSKKATLIKTVDENEMYYYSITDFPWPLTDRDIIFHATVTQDPVTKVVVAKSIGVPNYQANKKGVIRIPMVEVNWRFTPKGNNTVELDYHLKSDPGGNIPAWLINMTIDKGPVQSIKKFKEYTQRSEYKKAKYSFIAEL